MIAALVLAVLAGLFGSGPPAASTEARVGSGSASFIPSVTTTRATIWAVGDGADGSKSAQAVARLIVRSRHARFLYLGDVYERSTATDFATNYAPVYGALDQVTAPTPGNHEWANRRVGYNPYWAVVRGTRPPAYYAFSVAGWRILSLSSEAPHGPDSPQLRWLRRQVDHPGTCGIAFWHRPRYSAGPHGDQPDVTRLWNALRGHARIVLAGHDHNMQRLRRRDGITEFVAGAGGRSHYPVDRGYPGLAFANARADGALRLRLRRGVAEYAFVRADGVVLHSGSLRCRPA